MSKVIMRAFVPVVDAPGFSPATRNLGMPFARFI
jgi:hypothetical protein